MDDKLQNAINYLKAQGMLREAEEVEALRRSYNEMVVSFHAAQRASYADGLRDGETGRG